MSEKVGSISEKVISIRMHAALVTKQGININFI
jgi:hypothetical protein